MQPQIELKQSLAAPSKKPRLAAPSKNPPPHGTRQVALKTSSSCAHLFQKSTSTETATVGASIITNTILGVPYCNYSILGPKTLF